MLLEAFIQKSHTEGNNRNPNSNSNSNSNTSPKTPISTKAPSSSGTDGSNPNPNPLTGFSPLNHILYAIEGGRNVGVVPAAYTDGKGDATMAKNGTGIHFYVDR